MKRMELEVLKDKNLTLHIENVKEVEGIKYLDKEAIDNVIQRMENNRNRVFVRFLWNTGVRVSEALSVTKGDLWFSDNLIRIRWLKKRKEQTRTIPMHKSLKELLQLFSGSLNKADKLFGFTRQRAYQIVEECFGDGVSPHTFRHSFAVHYLRQGGRISDLCSLMGHSNLNVTMVYASIVKADLQDEVNKIDF